MSANNIIKSNLTHDHKHKIAYAYYIENTPMITIAKRYNLCNKRINEWLKEVVSDVGLTKAYLPDSYYNKTVKTHNYLFGKFKGYSEHLKDEMDFGTIDYQETITDEIKNKIIYEARSYSFNETDKTSFEERFDKYKTLKNEDPIEMQIIIEKKMLFSKEN
jgi:hypothetical protein